MSRLKHSRFWKSGWNRARAKYKGSVRSSLRPSRALVSSLRARRFNKKKVW